MKNRLPRTVTFTCTRCQQPCTFSRASSPMPRYCRRCQGEARREYQRELMRKRRLRQKAIAENLWMLRRTSLPQLHPAGPPPPGKEEVVVIERLGR